MYSLERHPGLASWVQAIGAIISIWAAWSIARSQSMKIEQAEMQRDRAKYEAVIGVLNHSKEVLQRYFEMTDYIERGAKLKADIYRLSAILDGLDLLSLPSGELVGVVCRIRSKLEDVKLSFESPDKASKIGFHFEDMVGKPVIALIEIEIEKCERSLSVIDISNLSSSNVKERLYSFFSKRK